MSDNLHTTWARLYNAIDCLASGNGSIQERVRDACIYALAPLRANEFPEELQKEFEMVEKELTKEQLSEDEGSVTATTKVMSEEKASEIARKIVSIYDKIARKYCSED